MSALHSAGNRADGEIALDGSDNVACEHGANFFVALPGQKLAKALLRVAAGLVGRDEALDGVRHFGGWAAVTDGARNRSNFAEAAAHAEVVGVHHFSFVLDFLAFDADIGDPVLAATVGAAGDMQLDLLVEAGEAFVEFGAQPAREALGFGQRELAEFGPGARHRASRESGGSYKQSRPGQFVRNGFGVLFGNVHEDQVLLRSGAEAAIAELVGEIGGFAELRRRYAAAEDGSANVIQAELLLLVDAQMVAVNAGGNVFFAG